MKELDDITGSIVDSAVKIHMELGPGLLESVYEEGLHRIVNNLPTSASPLLRVNQNQP